MFKLFKTEKCDHAEEYHKLLKRWADVEARITSLELNQDNMRNMARKIQKRKQEVEESEDTDTDMRNKVLVAV